MFLYFVIISALVLLEQVLEEADAERSLSSAHQYLRVVGQVEVVDPAHLRHGDEHDLVDGQVIANEQSLYHAFVLSYLREEDGVALRVAVDAGNGLVMRDLVLEEEDELVLGFYVYGEKLQDAASCYYCDQMAVEGAPDQSLHCDGVVDSGWKHVELFAMLLALQRSPLEMAQNVSQPPEYKVSAFRSLQEEAVLRVYLNRQGLVAHYKARFEHKGNLEGDDIEKEDIEVLGEDHADILVVKLVEAPFDDGNNWLHIHASPCQLSTASQVDHFDKTIGKANDQAISGPVFCLFALFDL